MNHFLDINKAWYGDSERHAEARRGKGRLVIDEDKNFIRNEMKQWSIFQDDKGKLTKDAVEVSSSIMDAIQKLPKGSHQPIFIHEAIYDTLREHPISDGYDDGEVSRYATAMMDKLRPSLKKKKFIS